MIRGHGDDIYQYGELRCNFSSNICQHADLTALKAHLASRLDIIANYPEPEAWSLEQMIAKKLGIPAECVIVTNGATDAIYLVAQTFRYRYQLLTPSFSEYEDACQMFPSMSNHTIRWICNPNNPTGDVFTTSDIRRLAKQDDLLAIDQSYEDYTDAVMLSAKEAVRMRNVIQLHSLTKTYGVPGLRIGYITAHGSLTALLRQNLRPWSVNALAIEAGKYLISHGQPLKPDLKEAQRLRCRLQEIEGITVDDTRTNFMLCELAGHTAAQLKDYLARKHGMLIRDASNFKDLTPHHFRIASQTPAENDALVEAIAHFVLNERSTHGRLLPKGRKK